MTAPLAGVRVIEAATWLAAPAAAALLADLGADVIKIEPPGGDPWRHFDTSSMGFEEPSAIQYGFELDNRGKRSIAVDLRQSGAPELVRRLCEEADVFVTNLMQRERWGIDERTLRAVNPALIYTAVSGYGERGPAADREGFDYAAFWASSGIMGLSGEPSSPPPFCRTGQGDHATALNLLSAILVALRLRDQSGEGQTVEVNLMQTGLWTIGADAAVAAVSGEQPRRYDRSRPWNPIRNSYQTRDGRWLLLGMTQADRFWPRFVAMIGAPSWALDPRFATLEGRKRHAAELRARIEELIASADLAEWGRRLDEAELVWAPVATLPEALADPQVEANGVLEEIEHPQAGAYRTLAAPFRVSGAETAARGPAPAPGEHTSEVLAELGLDDDEIASLAASGVFG
ncbi:MAG: CoA transferase [Chloroflexi bacterium]|nr:CoA transferase [Chloroflexota bacterium]